MSMILAWLAAVIYLLFVVFIFIYIPYSMVKSARQLAEFDEEIRGIEKDINDFEKARKEMLKKKY